jgi:hypothetical protein
MMLPNVQFPPVPCYLVPLNSTIFLSTLFSNILDLYSSLNVRDQISHPYKMTGKIIVVYIFNLYISGKHTRRQKFLDGMVVGIP